MDKRAFKIRNSKFLDFLINQAVYAVDSYASVLKFSQNNEAEIEACRQLIKGLLNELKFNKEFSKLLDELGLKPLYLTDVDRILRIDGKLIIFEFKHISQRSNGAFVYIKKHVYDTLSIIAKATESRLLLITKESGYWYVKDITELSFNGEYKAFKLSEFQKLDNKGFLEFLKGLIK